MAPLLVALCVEVALVAYAINRILWVAATLATALASAFAGLWYAYPRLKRRPASE